MEYRIHGLDENLISHDLSHCFWRYCQYPYFLGECAAPQLTPNNGFTSARHSKFWLTLVLCQACVEGYCRAKRGNIPQHKSIKFRLTEH